MRFHVLNIDIGFNNLLLWLVMLFAVTFVVITCSVINKIPTAWEWENIIIVYFTIPYTIVGPLYVTTLNTRNLYMRILLYERIAYTYGTAMPSRYYTVPIMSIHNKKLVCVLHYITSYITLL